ncbi:NAD(P)H-binding protein [Pontiellaceae bacterium B12227]|nr:NAD(P)H-binding protein [Pontiellaceae bacterium B12227]
MKQKKKILLTGATGYVGSKLLRELEDQGHDINCLTRNPDNLKAVGPNTRVFSGDVMIRSSMWRAFQGVDTAYFMIHMLHEREGFELKEIQAAENFAAMARDAGVKRIIYLGALGNRDDNLSPHLQSRQDVGLALRESHIPVLELRASIVIGKGSLSFEMIRDLTERLPFMVTPRWVSTAAQPISINDLLSYLVQAKDIELKKDEIVEIGSADRMSYGQLMKEYAKQRGLKRAMLPVPILSPKLSSHWLALITKIDPIIGRKLIEGIRNPTIVESDRASELFNIKPVSVEQAMAQALAETPYRETLEGFEHVYAA